MSKKTERFPLTEEQRKAIAALGKCSFIPGSFEKRFARDVEAQSEEGLTLKQYNFAKKLIFKYRKQIFGPTANTKQGMERAQLTVEAWFPELPNTPLLDHARTVDIREQESGIR